MGYNKHKPIHVDSILQYMPGCMYCKDANGVYLWCNEAQAKVLGFKSPKEVIGKTDYDLPWRQNAKTLLETDQRIMHSRVPEEVLEELANINGKLMVMLTKKSPLFDDKNNVIGIIGISIDITERKAKEELNTKLGIQSYVNNILQHIPGCIYWKDTNGVYLGCNQAEAKILGFDSHREVIGKTDFDLSWKYEAEILRRTDRNIMQSKIAGEVLEKVTDSSGKDVVMLTRKSPLYDNENKVMGIIGVSIDITERKRAEELQKKLEIQEELYRIAKKVAHDINSPISALKIVSYMSAKKLPEKEKKMLEMSITSIESIANTLLVEYKGIKRAEQGEAAVVEDRSAEKYISLYCGLGDVVESKQYQYKDSNVVFNYCPEESSKFAFVGGDFSDFCRMMHNLINNAVEALPQTKKADTLVYDGVIDISYTVKDEKVKIKVKDNGCGMSKEMMNRILSDIEEVGTTKEGGHGIGTQQIRDIVKEMKGKMEIQSQENAGTEFTLTFPQSPSPTWFAERIELNKVME
jgi:PAS domain S-box-containing protein